MNLIYDRRFPLFLLLLHPLLALSPTSTAAETTEFSPGFWDNVPPSSADTSTDSSGISSLAASNPQANFNSSITFIEVPLKASIVSVGSESNFSDYAEINGFDYDKTLQKKLFPRNQPFTENVHFNVVMEDDQKTKSNKNTFQPVQNLSSSQSSTSDSASSFPLDNRNSRTAPEVTYSEFILQPRPLSPTPQKSHSSQISEPTEIVMKESDSVSSALFPSTLSVTAQSHSSFSPSSFSSKLQHRDYSTKSSSPNKLIPTRKRLRSPKENLPFTKPNTLPVSGPAYGNELTDTWQQMQQMQQSSYDEPSELDNLSYSPKMGDYSTSHMGFPSMTKSSGRPLSSVSYAKYDSMPLYQDTMYRFETSTPSFSRKLPYRTTSGWQTLSSPSISPDPWSSMGPSSSSSPYPQSYSQPKIPSPPPPSHHHHHHLTNPTPPSFNPWMYSDMAQRSCCWMMMPPFNSRPPLPPWPRFPMLFRNPLRPPSFFYNLADSASRYASEFSRFRSSYFSPPVSSSYSSPFFPSSHPMPPFHSMPARPVYHAASPTINHWTETNSYRPPFAQPPPLPRPEIVAQQHDETQFQQTKIK